MHLYIYLFLYLFVFSDQNPHFFLRLSSVNHPKLSVSPFRNVTVIIFLSFFSSTGIHSGASR